MRGLRTALAAGGLVLMTGPLCFLAQGQDYVDLEAERATQSQPQGGSTPSAPQPDYNSEQARDPYAPAPSSAYPASSYGLDQAPAAATTITPAAPTAAAAPMSPPGQVGSTGSAGNLLLQLQQLQQEVMQLNGKVEEQAYELRRLKEQHLERYMDLDRRVSALSGGTPSNTTASGGSAGGGALVIPGGTESGSSLPEQPGEAGAYKAAYALVREQRFDSAVAAFQQFLRDYPGGRYAPNAHYWLGELYLVITPQDLEASRQAFTLLLENYPDHPKVPDALYKLGKVHYLKGNRERGREYLDRLIREYGASNHAAVKLAKDFLAENY